MTPEKMGDAIVEFDVGSPSGQAVNCSCLRTRIRLGDLTSPWVDYGRSRSDVLRRLGPLREGLVPVEFLGLCLDAWEVRRG